MQQAVAKPISKLLRYAIAYHQDGTIELTLFDDGDSASIELTAEEAKELSQRLLVKPDYRVDGDKVTFL